MPTRVFINRPMYFTIIISFLHHDIPIATHYPPSTISIILLRISSKKQILSSVSISKTGEWKRSRTHVRDSPRFRPNLRPWGERYYEEEHSFLTKGATTCSAFAHVRPLSIETTPTVLRKGGIRPGCVLSPRQPSFLRLATAKIARCTPRK